MTRHLATPESVEQSLETFRSDLRKFFDRNVPEDIRLAVRAGCLPTREQAARWQRILCDRGWGAPAWPREHGGTGWSLSEQAVYREELFASDAPHCDNIGIDTIGPTLIRFGTPEQCQRFLPRILSFDDYWAQGYSEPEAGSDLASLRTTASRDGDEWVLNGTKIWQSYGHWANWALVLARTDPSAPRRQDGISVLLVDLSSAGVSVRPIRLMNGAHFHVQIFFDNVRVPSTNLVGVPGDGWKVAKGLLVIERLFLARVAECKAELERARVLQQRRCAVPDTPHAHHSFALDRARLEIRMSAHEAVWWSVVRRANGATPLDFEASLLKVQGSELLQDIHQHQMRLLGLDALPFNPDGVAGIPSEIPLSPGHAENVPLHVWRFRGVTLGGGSSEIQRQILAKAIFSGSMDIERPRSDDLSEVQRMLADAVHRVLGESCSFERRRKRIDANELHDAGVWAMLTELGLPRLVAPESDGGLGGNLADAAVVAEAFGSHLALEPFLWSSVLATRLYVGATRFRARAERLNSLFSGAAIGCVALFESSVTGDLRPRGTRVRETRSGWCLNGRKRLVLGGHAADHLVVSARLPDGSAALFDVPVRTAGMSVRRYRTHDGQGCADFDFNEVLLPSESLMTQADAASEAIDEAVGIALVGLAADSVGCMRRALAGTVEHLRTRQQFGKALSEQPVIQNRIVEHYRGLLGTDAVLRTAVRDRPVDSGVLPVERARAAKACAGWAGRALALDAIQLHGAIGMQDECTISHYAKRLVTNDTLFGDSQAQLESYAHVAQSAWSRTEAASVDSDRATIR